MKHYWLLLSAGFFAVLCGCRFSVHFSTADNDLAKVWMYQPGSIKDEAVDSLLSYTNFLELRPDGKLSSYLGIFATGSWNFNTETQRLHLDVDGSRALDLPVGKDESGKLVLGLAALAIPRFAAFPVPGGWFHPDDPFAPANNQWRVIARQRETDRQIHERLISHCHFWVAYFNWANDNDVQLYDLRSIPSPVRIYGNGFGLTHFQDQPRPWRVNFYDSADAKKAYDLLRRVFSKNDIKWPDSENDYKRFAAGFEQVEEWIRKDGGGKSQFR